MFSLSLHTGIALFNKILQSVYCFLGQHRAKTMMQVSILLNDCVLYFNVYFSHRGFPGGSSGNEPACKYRRPKTCRFNPWVEKIPWKRAWQPAPVFLPGEFHAQKSLAGWSIGSQRIKYDWSDLTAAAGIHRWWGRKKKSLSRCQNQIWSNLIYIFE